MATLADPPARLPAHQPPQPARARLQGEGNINTPLELAIDNEIDRFSLAIDVINRVPRLQVAGAHAKEKFRDLQIDCRSYAHEHGIDKRRWPTGAGRSDARGVTRENEAHERRGEAGCGDATEHIRTGTSMAALKQAIMDNRFALLGLPFDTRSCTTNTRRSPTPCATGCSSASCARRAGTRSRGPAQCACSRPSTCSAPTPATTC